MDHRTILCFGFGFSANHLVRLMGAMDPDPIATKFIGTTRALPRPSPDPLADPSPDPLAETLPDPLPETLPDTPPKTLPTPPPQSSPTQLLVFNETTPLPKQIVQSATHILFSIPPDEKGDLAFRHHRTHIASSPRLRWAGYLSTSGVYGDCGGNWIDETQPPKPLSPQAQRRLKAEQQWSNLFADTSASFQIFRLPGIYGPTRSVLERCLNGTAKRVAVANHFSCRIHIEDIAQTLLASIHNPSDGTVYNVVDDKPAPTQEVVEYASRLLGLKPPPLVKLESLSPIAKRFYLENRRIKNHRIKTELGVRLKYPNYKKGLEAIYQQFHNAP